MTLLQKLNKFPPKLCRMVARVGSNRNQRLKTIKEIAYNARLSYRAAKRIASLSKWDGLTLEVVGRFSTACGVNLLQTYDHIRWLKFKARYALKSKTFQKWWIKYASDV